MQQLMSVASIILMFSGVAQAGVDQKASAFVLCKQQKSVRTIKVLSDPTKQENCTITYNKGGVEEVVGSNRSIASCKSILKQIQSNLESSKWSCRSVETARVLTSSEVSRK